MKAADLNLRGAAKAGAFALEAQFPGIVFTSGRREVADQARAMTGNIILNRRWIAETYTNTAESRQLQAWVTAHPNVRGREDLAKGLAAIMADWSDDARARLSRHFSADAFDVQPVLEGPRARAIPAAIRKLGGLDKFLEREGGLLRWHAQFR